MTETSFIRYRCLQMRSAADQTDLFWKVISLTKLPTKFGIKTLHGSSREWWRLVRRCLTSLDATTRNPPPTHTRWTTELSSKVNIPDASTFKALCGTNLAKLPPESGPNDTCVVHREMAACEPSGLQPHVCNPHGTNKTDTAKFWPRRSGQSP